jgi:hypothetical protein
MNQHQRIVTEEALEKAAPQQFWSKVTYEPNCGCWLWVGAINSTGYGAFWFEKRSVSAHRFLHDRLFGHVPGLDLDHLCRVRNCVNPTHLERVTRSENMLRGVNVGCSNRLKTHCPNGHPYSGSNLETLAGTDGFTHRRCIICRNATRRRFTIRHAEKRGACE